MQVKIDAKGIRDIIPHRYPILLLDYVSEYEEGVYAVGHKGVTQTEPFLQGHFPDDPIMPGVLQVEAMAQLCAVLAGLSVGKEEKGRIMLLASVQDARFSTRVVPGMRMDIRVEIQAKKMNIQKYLCRVDVDGKKASTAVITGAMV